MLLGAMAIVAANAVTGCARTVADASLVERAEIQQDELEFLSELENQAVVTNDDALHGLFLLERGEDPFETYEQRVEEARRLGWLPLKGDPPPANESATVGMVSVAIVRTAGIKGGITMRVLGPTQRAATRELVFLTVLPDRTARQALTGPEFIEVLGRADRLLLGEQIPDVERSIQRIDEDLPENVRDLQQERQRSTNPR